MSEQYQGEDFATYIERERERLNSLRRALNDRIAEYQAQLREVDREFTAIGAYVSAKTGKPLAVNPPVQRARRMRRRDDIMSALGAAPLGMTRGDLLEHLGVKGDKPGEAAVSNALSQMQRQGQVIRQADGRWAIVGAESLQQAAE